MSHNKSVDSDSVVDESGAGARTVGVGAGAQAGYSSGGAEVTSDTGQAESWIDLNLSVARQREFERQASNAQVLKHQANLDALSLQKLANDTRHADSGFQTRLETISDGNLLATSETLKALGDALVAIAANMATGRPPVNQDGGEDNG